MCSSCSHKSQYNAIISHVKYSEESIRFEKDDETSNAWTLSKTAMYKGVFLN